MGFPRSGWGGPKRAESVFGLINVTWAEATPTLIASTNTDQVCMSVPRFQCGQADFRSLDRGCRQYNTQPPSFDPATCILSSESRATQGRRHADAGGSA